MMRTNATIRTMTAVTAIGGLAALAGCTAAEPMTLDTIGGRTAEAIRSAETLRFTMADDDIEHVGALRYEDGELAALRLETHGDGPGGSRTEWVVDGEYWVDDDTSDVAVQSDSVTPEALLASWDWAQVQEDLADAATEFEEAGTRSLDDVKVTGYTITSDDRVETWWLDGDDRLRAYEYEIVGEDLEGSGSLFAFGTDVEIVAPN